mmetsp:Transcript_1635/g.7144  ORF Transcript_1635/g.7144 Transcript_1635/m.7144 type:complete len:227 (+) Transcript_1635:1932-2612(+)
MNDEMRGELLEAEALRRVEGLLLDNLFAVVPITLLLPGVLHRLALDELGQGLLEAPKVQDGHFDEIEDVLPLPVFVGLGQQLLGYRTLDGVFKEILGIGGHQLRLELREKVGEELRSILLDKDVNRLIVPVLEGLSEAPRIVGGLLRVLQVREHLLQLRDDVLGVVLVVFVFVLEVKDRTTETRHHEELLQDTVQVADAAKICQAHVSGGGLRQGCREPGGAHHQV